MAALRFGTDGVRGRVHEELSLELAAALGRAAAEGVTARVLQDPNRFRSRHRIGCQLRCQQRRLPLLLPAPGLGEGHQLLRLKKNCRMVLGALV